MVDYLSDPHGLNKDERAYTLLERIPYHVVWGSQARPDRPIRTLRELIPMAGRGEFGGVRLTRANLPTKST